MLSCIRRPTINYNLTALAEDSYVSVGRETEAHIQLDSVDIPCLLSRKHANLVQQPGGTFTVVDLGSTNGTFAARQNQPLRKLPPGYAWELQHGDTVGFGGPETIIVKRAQVGNPFLFMYYTTSKEESSYAAATQSACVGSGHGTPKAGQQLISSEQHKTNSCPGPVQTISTTTRARRTAGGQTACPSHPVDEPMADSSHMAQRDQQSQPHPLSCRSPHSARHPNGKENRTAAQHMCTPRSNKKLADSMHNHLNCPVCCDTLLASHMLHCGHMFCGLCLATWMTQNHSCPSCRKIITGVPVRCFTVDNMISDVLSGNHQSPGARTERKRKQEHWDNIQRLVVQDWVTALQRRRDAAVQEAARHNQELQAHVMTGVGAAVAAAGRNDVMRVSMPPRSHDVSAMATESGGPHGPVGMSGVTLPVPGMQQHVARG